MSAADTLLALAAFWALAVLTPGPNMMLFTAIALASPPLAVLAGGAGIVLGTALWGMAGLFGLLWFFQAFPTLGLAVKLVGALYLGWMGLSLVRRSLARVSEGLSAERKPMTPRRAFVVSLLTNLSNPKSLVFVTSLFAVTRLAEAPLATGLAGVAIMVAMSATYYVALGLLLAYSPLSRGDGRLKRAIGVIVGALMMAFGARMALER